MSTPQKAPIRILLVDDHVVVRAGLRLIIQSRRDMTIVGEAGNSEQAVSLAEAQQPDIVLLDLDLGGESGGALISGLTAAAPELKVIILTGLRDPDAQREAVMLGAMGIVQKEKAASVLIGAIERVHAGEAWLDPALVAGVLGEVTGSRSRKRDPETAKMAALTTREREVIGLVGEGIKNKEIADRLSISETTVRHHLTSIFDKLEVTNRVELLIYAFRNGLASPPK